MTAAAALKHVAFDDSEATKQAVFETMRADGGVIVDGMIDPDVLNGMLADVTPHVDEADPTMEHVNPILQWFFGDRTRHVAALAAKSPTFARDVLPHPLLMAVCDEFLLPHCASYCLNLGHLIVRGPGAKAQIMHRDEGNWTTFMPRPYPEMLISSMTALVDFNKDNGATLIVPGSHRWEEVRRPDPSEIAVAEMAAGSTVIYYGSTVHAAGNNVTEDKWRLGLHMSYALGWLRTEENNYLGCPPAIARNLPPRSQELLGYSIHDTLKAGGGYLGMLELQSPMAMLADGSLT
jgi:ectoine hydroxylase-related dioxygenase (phytanoyl-CoA dioxygenase family)